MLRKGAEAVQVGMQTRFESFVKCEEQPWPDSGGPPNMFIPPHAVSGGKTAQTFSSVLGVSHQGDCKRVPSTGGPCPSWVLPTSELWEAGERLGSACAIEVEGLQPPPPPRPPPPLPLEFRV